MGARNNRNDALFQWTVKLSTLSLSLSLSLLSWTRFSNVTFSRSGDEIIAINGRKVEGLVHAEVVSLFREVRRGATISIVCGRKLPKNADGMYVTADQLTQLAQQPQPVVQ